jgi:transcriptional regulator with GAF, ATPase, and Fis domain
VRVEQQRFFMLFKTTIMKNTQRTKAQLVIELEELRKRVAELEASKKENKRAEEALSHSREFNRVVLMSLQTHIAVLDKKGIILDVNESWMRFARENEATSMDRVGPDVNYLEVCQRSAEASDESAKEAIEGIRRVLDGSNELFELEYPCHSPSEQRWFLMSVMPLRGPEGGGVVAHTDITERKEAELEVQKALSEISRLKEQLEEETAYLQEEIKSEHNHENIIGTSNALKYVLHKVEQIAPTDTTVLILGETGTGKELIARAIHSSSPRKGRAMVKVNCATLPANLIESELFGHEKGAFTGAQTRQVGRFEVADGTTIFLDEIGELSLELQAKLLRVLEHGQFERLGSVRTIKVDLRVIAATNRNLEEEVQNGNFRQDLWYRLNVFPITVPPLRIRKGDVPLLVDSFVKKFSRPLGKSIETITQATMKTLENYSWPGNVRELENVIERAVINTEGTKLWLADKLEPPQGSDLSLTQLSTLAEIERDHIIQVLEEKNWTIEGEKGAAVILGLNPSTLRARLRKLGIKRPT